MVLLERSPVCSSSERCVGDTVTRSIEYILSILNGFYPNIEIVYETEFNSKLLFLDISLLREGQNIITIFYRKVAISDVYLNWNSFCLQG